MEFVILRSFQNYFQAHILLTKLQDAGVTCLLKDEFTVTMDPILSNAVGGIKLMVSKDDEAKAIELIKRSEEEYRESIVCPRCKGKHIVLVPKQSPSNLFLAILTWILGSYAISARNVYRCSDCGYECDELPEPTEPIESENL